MRPRFDPHYSRVFVHCTVGNYQVYNWSLGMMTGRMVFAINITRQWADHTAPRCPQWHHQCHSYPGLRNPGPRQRENRTKDGNLSPISHWLDSLSISEPSLPVILLTSWPLGRGHLCSCRPAHAAATVSWPIKNYSIIDDFLLLIWNWYGVIRSHHLQFITGGSSGGRWEEGGCWSLES